MSTTKDAAQTGECRAEQADNTEDDAGDAVFFVPSS
jgi:hypothetical protein